MTKPLSNARILYLSAGFGLSFGLLVWSAAILLTTPAQSIARAMQATSTSIAGAER